MSKLFLHIVNAGITASYVVLAVLLLRLLLKKAPKWVSCLLWAAVAVRLLLPVSFQTGMSLLPSVRVLPPDLGSAAAPEIYSGIAVVDKAVNPAVAAQIAKTGSLESVLSILTIAWLVGLVLFAVYGTVTTIQLYRRVQVSVCLRDNIYICDDVDSPFILGMLRPRVFLPSGMAPEQMEAVIAHEEAHLKRKDHWWKPLGYLLLMVYWFNPLIWVAYIFLCRDIELACDEKVISHMDRPEQKTYLETLLASGSGKRLIHVCPLAFGEVGVKERIKAVLHYKKPAFWILIASGAALLVFLVCFLTDPAPCEHSYQDSITQAATCAEFGVRTFACDNCGHTYTEPVEKLAHTYGEGVVTLASTCTAEGVQEFSCTGCGYTKKDVIPKEAHTFEETLVEKAPNCTDTGERTGVCIDCNQKLLVEVLPVNEEHDLHLTVTKEATCTEEGEGTNTCSRCNHTETVVLEKLGHNYKVGMVMPARCCYTGQRQEICQTCGKEQWYDTPIDPDAHSWMYIGGPVGTICSWCHRSKD